MASAKLSKSFVDKVKPVESDRIFWDAELAGFGIRVKTSGGKSDVVQYRNRATGRSRRKTIGRHGPLMTFHQAREIARGLLADVARGADPVAELKTLREVVWAGESHPDPTVPMIIVNKASRAAIHPESHHGTSGTQRVVQLPRRISLI